MKIEDKLIRGIARRYGKDPRVIRQIVYHPFLFTKRVMEDPIDDRPVRVRFFGAFVQKNTKNKKFVMGKKKEILLENIDEVFEAVLATGRHTEDIESKQDLEEMIGYVEDHIGGIEFVNSVWDIWKEHIK